MSRNRLIVSLTVALVAAGSQAAVARAQTPEPAAAAAAPARPAVDSNAMWAGDWDFQIQLRDSTIGGGWRLNYVDGRFSGIVARPGVPPSPIRSFTLRTNKRDMQLTVDWNGEEYVFTGRLENARNIQGQVSFRGGIGRLRAQKRG
jgi:hypothetical protein